MRRAARHARHVPWSWHAATGPLLQPLRIPAHGVGVRERVANGIDNRGEHRIGRLPQPIVNPQPVPPCFDESGATEIRQVPRRLRLWNLQALVDVAHADLTGQQQPENPESGRIGQRLEQRFHLD